MENKSKMKYESPEAEKIEFGLTDIITASNLEIDVDDPNW